MMPAAQCRDDLPLHSQSSFRPTGLPGGLPESEFSIEMRSCDQRPDSATEVGDDPAENEVDEVVNSASESWLMRRRSCGWQLPRCGGCLWREPTMLSH